MDGSKYGKYIITDIKPNLKVPEFRGADLTKVDWSTQFLYLDEEVIKDGFYFECIWLGEAAPSPEGANPHTHDSLSKRWLVGEFFRRIRVPVDLVF